MRLGEGPLQFGSRVPGQPHPDRPAAFGVLARQGDGRLALVRIERPGVAAYVDLPGGAIEAGEDGEAAVAREFGEETGLAVRPGRLIGRANQYLVKTDGTTANNLCVFHEVDLVGEDPGLKQEADHTLVWMAPDEALRRLRHDAHAWAVLAWMRAGAGPQERRTEP